MTVLMFEGFECMSAVDQGLHVFDDYLNDWGGGNPFLGLSVATYAGHGGGYAMGSGYNNFCKAESSTGKMRVGFWGYDLTVDDNSTIRSWLTFQNDGKNYGSWCDHDGKMFLGMSSSDSRSGTVQVRDATSAWHHYEFYVDVTLGQMSVNRDGVMILSSTTMDVGDATKGISIVIGNLGVLQGDAHRWYTVFDDWYVTDGPAVSGIAGVAVLGLLDQYTVTDPSASFRFGLIINGNRYQSSIAQADFSSQGVGSGGLNTCRQVTRYWLNDPSDGQAWNAYRLSTISSWGYCWGTDTVDTGEYRILSGALTYLDCTGDYPAVKTIKPSKMTYFSGTHWSKSDPTKVYSALLPLPRDNTQLTSSTPKAVYCNGPGCMFFDASSSTGTGTVESLGLTFAEEYRTDFHDWVKLDGTGQDFKSFFVSGYGIYGQGDKKFSSTYVTINYENSNESVEGAAYVQGVWDYATSNTTGQYSMRQRVYQNSKDNYEHRARRLKIRGRGKALQLYISSEEGKQFGINGWTMFITSNTNV